VIKLFGAKAICDQYRAAGVAERLRRYGIQVRVEAMTAPTKDAAFGFLRGRINEGSIELPEHTNLVRELRAIRTRYAAGRSSVVLPRISGSHCDLAQSLAIAVYEHDRRSLGGDDVTISRPRGTVAAPRFHEPQAPVFDPVLVRGDLAAERMAAIEEAAAGAGTRWRPELR
jgi:hypothetical protein